MTAEHSTPTRFTYLGLFLVALATLTHQVLLTRIFSVTMWYHFAFVAISIAMFGMTQIVRARMREFGSAGQTRYGTVVARTT